MEAPFPYEPRPVQRPLIDRVQGVLEAGGHLVCEAPTGSGKTVAVLAPCVADALDHDRRVCYLTRTNAQQTQVVRELAEIADAMGEPIPYAPLQGRAHLCTLAEEVPLMGRADPDELGRLCRDRQEATARSHPRRPGDDGCRAYARWLDAGDDLAAWAGRQVPTAEELVAEGRDRDVCPYETVRDMTDDAVVVTAPYVYLLEPGLRTALLTWLGADLDELIVVADEAHNLPEMARSLAGDELTRTTLERAEAEARERSPPPVLEDLSVAATVELVRLEVETLANAHAGDDDALLPPDALREALMTRFQTTDVELRRAFEALAAAGEAIRQARRREGGLPRSYLGRVGTFLLDWFGGRSVRHARIVAGGTDPGLRRVCLDPRERTDVLDDVHASLHVSGTIADLDAYRRRVGLPAATRDRLRWPALADRLEVLYDETVTTRHDELAADASMFETLRDRVDAILEAAPVGTLVAFPSYALLDRFVAAGLDGDLVEQPGIDQTDLHARLAAIRAQGGGRILGVAGGRLCEGIDLPGEALRLVVQVGIPYPPPDAERTALKRFHGAAGRDGFREAIHLPAAQRLRQTVGRLVRGPDERGVAVILDRRAERFSSVLPGLSATDDPARRAASALRSARPA